MTRIDDKVVIGHSTPAGRSVLEDLDLDPAYVAKAKLAQLVKTSVREMGLTQMQAAELLGTTQPRYSKLSAGKLDLFSMEMLQEFLMKLGHDIALIVEPRHEGAGRRAVALVETDPRRPAIDMLQGTRPRRELV